MTSSNPLIILTLLTIINTSQAKKLCTGDPCTTSLQCDRFSACYSTREDRTKGRCYFTDRGTKIITVGSYCQHSGDCDECSYCDLGSSICRQLKRDFAPPDHSEIETLRNSLTEKYREVDVERQANNELQEQLEYREEQLHRTRHTSILQSLTLKFIVIVVATFTLVVVALVLQRFIPRRIIRAAPAISPTAPPAEAPELSSSDDEEVSESEEAALLGQHASVAVTETNEPQPRTELDPEDPNTCKICYENQIDCVLLGCGHMCVCMKCAKRLRNCPICRVVIKKRKRIFRP